MDTTAYPNGSGGRPTAISNSESTSSSNGGGGGGGGHDGEKGASGFGLGVGLAVSPELARKVRECRGMGSAALRVPESSLTFLKGSGSGEGRSSSSPSPSSSPLSFRGTVNQTHGTVNSTKETVRNSPKADISNASAFRVKAKEGCEYGGLEGDKTPTGLETLEKDDALDSWEDFDESSLSCVPSRAQETPAEQEDDAGRVGGNTGSMGHGGEKQGATDVEGDALRVESLPMLLVDLGRVCGFRLTRTEDAEEVGGRVRAALHESFRERSEELFEMGSAVHADTLSQAEELRRRSEGSSSRAMSCWAAIDYPREVDRSSVKEAWAAVTAPSKSEAVEAVRVALVGTNRNLIWKRDMLEQLEAIAAREREARDLREAERRLVELEAWRLRRREQLQKLIEIRPMFERRRAMAEEKLVSLGKGDVEIAEDPVSAAVVKGLDAKLDSIDDLIARLEIEEGEDGYRFVPSDDDDVIDDDYDVIDHKYNASGAKGERESTTVAAPAADDQDKNGATKTKKKPKKKKQTKKGKPGIVERLQTRGRASSMDENLPEKSGERDREGRDIAERDGRGASSTEEAPPMSLLDAVAAMILGRYPQDPDASTEEHFKKIAAMHQHMKDPDASTEEHFKKIAAMHQHMKDAWNTEFGRLPENP